MLNPAVSENNEKIIEQPSRLLTQLDKLIPEHPVSIVDFKDYAYRWHRHQDKGYIQPVNHPSRVCLDDLQCIDRQKERINRNTQQFLQGYPANNVLLWGPRGTGKSSLIKAIMNEYQAQGLKLVEVEKQYLTDLPDIIDQLDGQNELFILFCDDLSYEPDDSSYKAMQVILDGSIHSTPENILIYATSNRRHLMPEYMSDNLQSKYIGEELHLSETIEEKISLSERFGLWLAFHPFNQDQYLTIVEYWLNKLGYQQYDEAVRKASLKWALKHGSKSGRCAWQFARDWTGQLRLRNKD